jgi:hypothetical protein
MVGLMGLGLVASPAAAQPLGTVRWQLVPFCNVVTFSVQQILSAFILVGADDQCGAPPPAAAVGTGVLQTDGSVRLGFTTIGPNGVPAHTEATVNPATLAGIWRDGEGNSGDFLPSPPAPAAGSARPAPVMASGTLGPGVITTTLLAPGAVTTDRLAPGSVTSGNIADGTIGAADLNPTQVLTAVQAGAGLVGGGASGRVTLSLAFAGSGTASTAARSDHDHDNRYYTRTQADSLFVPRAAVGPRGLVGQAEVLDNATFRYRRASNGQTITASRSGPGVYVITFPGFGIPFLVFDQTVQVTASSTFSEGTWRSCGVASRLTAVNGDLTVQVNCVGSNLIPVDTSFFITVLG